MSTVQCRYRVHKGVGPRPWRAAELVEILTDWTENS